jgi:hypothetical protein
METCRTIAAQDRAGHRKPIADQMLDSLQNFADK